MINVEIVHNNFSDNFTSIAIGGDGNSPLAPSFDPAMLRTTFAVYDNNIIGNGPNSTGIQRGIVIIAGATGEVRQNLIADHAYTGGNDFSEGILGLDFPDFGSEPLASLKPVLIERNFFRNNQEHIVLALGDGSAIINNSFQGAPPSYRPMGIALSGKDTHVTGNSFNDLEVGILLFGEDPDFGTYLGLSTDSRLIGNRFCRVAVPIVAEPMVVGTQEHGNRLNGCDESPHSKHNDWTK